MALYFWMLPFLMMVSASTKSMGMFALSTSAESDLITCTIWSADLQLPGVQNQPIFSR